MERKWVVAAFLDIIGFRSWTYRAATAPEVKEEFIREFYRVLQCYVKHEKTVWAKYEGDGLLLIKEFTPDGRKDNLGVVEFVSSLRTLYRKVHKVLSDCEESPTGARIRVMTGYVYKLNVVDPHDQERQRTINEYLEYCTNTVRGLLEVNPEIACLATKSLVKSLGKQRSLFRVRSLREPSCYPKGINKEDVDGLEILKF